LSISFANACRLFISEPTTIPELQHENAEDAAQQLL